MNSAPDGTPASVMRTDRLLLRPWQPDEPSDVAAAYDIYSRPDVMRWIGGPEHRWTDHETARDKLQGWSRLDDGVRGAWALVPQSKKPAPANTPIGTVLLRYLPGGMATEIGWTLHTDARGSGYATEAACAIVERARQSSIPEVHALVFADNNASLAVCDRLGMKRLGTTSQWYDVTALDHVLHLDE